MKHAMEVNGQFLEAGANASRFLHPSDALFDYGALSIGRPVEPDPTVVAGRFVALVRNDRLDAASSKPVADAWNAVPFVGGQFLWTCSRTPQTLWDGDTVHYPLDLRRFVDLPGSDLNGQGSSVAVSNQVELRSKPASAAAQRVVRRFVGMAVETSCPAPPAAGAPWILSGQTRPRPAARAVRIRLR